MSDLSCNHNNFGHYNTTQWLQPGHSLCCHTLWCMIFCSNASSLLLGIYTMCPLLFCHCKAFTLLSLATCLCNAHQQQITAPTYCRQESLLPQNTVFFNAFCLYTCASVNWDAFLSLYACICQVQSGIAYVNAQQLLSVMHPYYRSKCNASAHHVGKPAEWSRSSCA